MNKNHLIFFLTILGFSLVGLNIVFLDYPHWPFGLSITAHPSGGLAAGNSLAQNQVPHILTSKERLEEIRSSVVSDVILVKLKSGSDVSALQQLNVKYGVREVKPVFKRGKSFAQIRAEFNTRSRRAPGDTAQKAESIYNSLSQWQKITLAESNADKVFAAVAEYSKSSAVEFVQPNYKVKTQFIPNDPYYHSQGSWGQQSTSGDYQDLWGLKKIQLEQAWDVTQGQGVTVAVVDTGVDYTHPDIAANIWTNSREIPNNGVDDDGNGYVDDVRGWNFSSSNNDPIDGFGHGTHVAGTIAAVGNNNLGVIGVAPQAKVMPVKGFDDSGSGYISNLAQGIIYAASNGASVINNSWGCYQPCPSNPIVENAVTIASGMGSVVVFAAGNFQGDTVFWSPQNMSETITVGGSDPLDQWADSISSNYGLLVDVAAPAGGTRYGLENGGSAWNVLSLSKIGSVLEQQFNLNIVSPGYMRLAGTSMATPHVAGLAALVLATHPNFTPEEVRRVLRFSADPIRTPSVYFPKIAPRVNAFRALGVNSVLSAKITAPRSANTFSPEIGSITIRGTAAGPGFNHYQLFYGHGPKPANWIPITDVISAPVQDGTLGTWTFSNFETDFYSLLLIVTDQSGNEFRDVVQVAIEPAYRRLSASPVSMIAPAISGNYIVYADDRNSPLGFPDLYLYDLSTNTDHRLTNTPNSADFYYPEISGNLIVWTSETIINGVANDDIYLCEYNPLTGDCPSYPISTAPGNQLFPQIDGTRIVWQDRRNQGSYYDIYYCEYNRADHTCPERRITTSSTASDASSISGNRIVWSDLRNSNFLGDVYLYDLLTSTERRITTTQNVRGVSISGDRIVWTGYSTPVESAYVYDLRTNTQQQIVINNNTHVYGANIFGNFIALTGNYWPNESVYLYNIAQGTMQRVTSDFHSSFSPSISGTKMIWTDFRNGRWDAYLYEIPSPHITLSPSSTSVHAGDYLVFDVAIENRTSISQTLTGWIDAFGPNGSPYQNNPIFGPQTFTIQPGRTVTRTVRQRIPANRPPSGPYTVRAYIGSYPNDWIDSSSFQFNIVP